MGKYPTLFPQSAGLMLFLSLGFRERGPFSESAVAIKMTLTAV